MGTKRAKSITTKFYYHFFLQNCNECTRISKTTTISKEENKFSMNVLLQRKDFGEKKPLLFHYRSRSLFLEKKKFDVRIKRENVKCIKAALGRMEGKKSFIL